jgi:hypothetical protein
MKTLEEFNLDLENYLKRIGSDGFKIEYHRPDEPFELALWMQKHLDEFGITDIDYEFNDGKLEMKNLKFDQMGKPLFPYEIKMKSELNSPHNIELITLKK